MKENDNQIRIGIMYVTVDILIDSGNSFIFHTNDSFIRSHKKSNEIVINFVELWNIGLKKEFRIP